MRKNFMLVVLVPLVILLVVVYFFLDSWVEYGIETAGEKVVGAKVEIDDLKVSLIPIGIEWKKIQVANPNDPWTNIFETGKVKFQMDVGQLLRGKYIIDTVDVEDIVIGTKRTTDGSLPKGEREKAILFGAGESFTKTADEVLKQTLASSPLLDIDKLKKGFNADSLIKILDIKTLGHMDSIKQEIADASKEWESITNDFENSKSKLLEIEKNIKAINPSELNNAPTIIATLATVDNAIKNVNEIKQTFTNHYQSINSDINNLTGLISTIDDVAKSDFEKLKSMAKLPTLSTEGIAQILVGNEMYKRAMSYLGWVDLARNNIKKYSPEPDYEKPARFEGQDISFPVERGYPKFWIKNVKISGRTEKELQTDFFSAKGEAHNITNNQTLTGVPLSFSLDGTYSDRRDLHLSGLIDRTKDAPFDEYTVKLSGVALSSFELGNKNFLPSKITEGRMNTAIKISVPGNGFDSQIDIDLSNFSFTFEAESRSIVERLVREVLEGIRGFNVKMRLWNTGGTFKVALSTDLDKILSQRLMSVIGTEIANLQNQLRDKFNAIINQKRDEFNQFYNTQKEKIENKISAFQTLLNDKLSIVDVKKKELQDRLDKVQKGLGNQLLDLLKKGG